MGPAKTTSQALQVAGLGEIVERIQADQLEESRGGCITSVFVRLVGASRHGNQSEPDELLQGTARVGAALTVDIGARNGLAIGDQGEHVASARGQARLAR